MSFKTLEKDDILFLEEMLGEFYADPENVLIKEKKITLFYRWESFISL